MRDIPVPLVIGVDHAPSSPQGTTYQANSSHKIMRIGPVPEGLLIAVFAVPKADDKKKTFSADETLVVGTVRDIMRVTLFGDVAHYVDKSVVIRVRGKQANGVHVHPFETTLDGDKIAEAVYEKHAKGGVGTIVRTVVKEDFILDEKERQEASAQFNDIVDAAQGVTVDDYAALGEFIVQYKNRRH